jgi:hypothetical protein
MAVALLCTTSIAGCSRSVTLPPLVDDQDAPQIPGKFVWHNRIVLLTVMLLGLAASSCYVSGGYVGYGYTHDYYNDPFYTPPDRSLWVRVLRAPVTRLAYEG